MVITPNKAFDSVDWLSPRSWEGKDDDAHKSRAKRGFKFVMPAVASVNGRHATSLREDPRSGFSFFLDGSSLIQLSLGTSELDDTRYFGENDSDEEMGDGGGGVGQGEGAHADGCTGPAIVVRQRDSWIPQFLCSLAILDAYRGVVKYRFSLVDASRSSSSSSDAEKAKKNNNKNNKKKTNKKGAAAGDGDGVDSAAEEDAEEMSKNGGGDGGGDGGGASGSGQKRRKGAAPKSKKKAKIVKNDGASVTAAAAAAVDTNEDENIFPSPTHVKVQIWLTHPAMEWFYERTGNTLSRSSGLLSFWNQNSRITPIIISTLLLHGHGLSIGPDSDGILNFCDADAEEVEAVLAATPRELLPEFNVSRILSSVALNSRQKAATTHNSFTHPEKLLSEPKKYQFSGLQWSLDRERLGDAMQRGSLSLSPLWVQLTTADSSVIYMNKTQPHCLTDIFYSAPSVGTCGGCMCDEMGLGKSLNTLLLIAENEAPAGWAVDDIPRDQLVNHENPIPIKTTLLVAPNTLLSQWEDEVRKHLAPGALRWGRFVSPNDTFAMTKLLVQAERGRVDDSVGGHGRNGGGASGSGVLPQRRSIRAATMNAMMASKESSTTAEKKTTTATAPTAAKDTLHMVPFRRVLCATENGTPAEMQTLDLCFCSYEDLREQLGSTSQAHLSTLQQFGYWRVCLDEAQLVANSSSVAAIMGKSVI